MITLKDVHEYCLQKRAAQDYGPRGDQPVNYDAKFPAYPLIPALSNLTPAGRYTRLMEQEEARAGTPRGAWQAQRIMEARRQRRQPQPQPQPQPGEARLVPNPSTTDAAVQAMIRSSAPAALVGLIKGSLGIGGPRPMLGPGEDPSAGNYLANPR